MATTAERLARIKLRLSDVPDIATKDDLLSEMATTIEDRIMLRVGATTFPDLLASVSVDATVKAYRRVYFEGISQENDDGLSVAFYEDVLAEYADELEGYRASLAANADAGARVVKFV